MQQLTLQNYLRLMPRPRCAVAIQIKSALYFIRKVTIRLREGESGIAAKIKQLLQHASDRSYREVVQHKKILTAGLAALFLGCILGMNGWEILVVEKVAAQAAPPHPDQFYNTAIQLIGFVQHLLLWLLYRVLSLLERLFDPNAFITEYLVPQGGGVGPLQTLWMHARDIVNVILAFLLIGGAVMTIVFAKGDFFKNNIIKFLVAIILVNFSWFFPRVIIDTANVLTATVYSLPAAIDYHCQGPLVNDVRQKCFVWEDPQFDLNEAEQAAWIALGNDYDCTPDFLICYKKVPLEQSANSPAAILLGLVLNNASLFELSKIPDIPDGQIENVPLGTDRASKQIRIIIYAAFSLIMIGALFFPLLAMLVVFIVRIPYLWLTIAFMPFMFLGLILGDKMGEFDTMKIIWKKFLGAAFVPLFVAIPLALGFILLNVGMETIVMPNWGEVTTGLFSFKNFLDLLWLCMTLGVLWMGTFMALKAAHIAEGVVTSIQNFGQSLGKGIAKMPLRIPFIPAPSGKGLMSVGGAVQGIKTWGNSGFPDKLDEKRPGSGGGPNIGGEALAQEIEAPNYVNINNDVHVKLDRHYTVLEGETLQSANDVQNIGDANTLRNLKQAIVEIKMGMEEAARKVGKTAVITDEEIAKFANKHNQYTKDILTEAAVTALRSLP